MTSLKEKAYNIIRKKIVSCEMMPGDIINEKLLIAQTGCGRTPVREALNILARDGLVRIIPRRGMFVTEISVKDIRDMFILKQELEPIIVRMAGNKIPEDKLKEFRQLFSSDMDLDTYVVTDYAFHSLILDACDNKYYKLVMDVVSDQSQRLRILTNEAPDRICQSSQEHITIIDALLAKDVEEAARAMMTHYENSLKSALDFLNLSEYITR